MLSMVYMAMTFEKQKPIERVAELLHSMDRDLNQIKIEMLYIKSEMLLIKHHLKNEEKAEEEKDQIAKGWFF